VPWRHEVFRPTICRADKFPGRHRDKGTIPVIPNWRNQTRREVMGFGRGFLLWILGIPLPIILLLALFWR
jgi:hypothetical protein